MAERVKLDMEEMFCGYVPDEVLMDVMAFLPITSLLRFRTVSKSWNDILTDTQFHKIRKSLRREFAEEVMLSRKFRACKMEFSVKGVLLMVRGRHEIYIVQPSKVCMRLLPRLECSLDLRKLEFSVTDLFVDERTKDYTVFAVSRFSPALQAPCGVEQASVEPPPPKWIKNLHYFNSSTDVWSVCGSEGLDLNVPCRVLAGVTVHRDRFTTLVMDEKTSEIFFIEENYRYELLCYNESRWEKLPGDLPKGFPHFPYSDLSIFDHRGTLYVAEASYSGCSLWKYLDDTLKWVLIDVFRNPSRAESDWGSGNADFVSNPYAQAFGDLLHFAWFWPQIFMVETLCQRMTYNLVTGKLDTMSRDEDEVMAVRNPRSGQNMLLHLG